MQHHLVHCVVPARLASTRFPNKPLANILGVPMVVRTLRRAQMANCFESIICATDSEAIVEVVEQAGFRAVMTPSGCRNGTERVASVSSLLDLPLVVNLQGDEPVASPELLRTVALTLAEEPDSWVTASTPLEPKYANVPETVKVCVNDGYATDFVRNLLEPTSQWHTHRGIYAYSNKSLAQYMALAPTTAEQSLSLEQMRILGLCKIRVVEDSAPSLSVDLPSHIHIVEQFLQSLGES